MVRMFVKIKYFVFHKIFLQNEINFSQTTDISELNVLKIDN